MQSQVEKLYLERNNAKRRYRDTEKIDVIVVDTFPNLGKLTALRFLEWVQQNPGGVVSLPTGKTPQYFIREVNRFLDNWDQKEVQQEVGGWGLDPKVKPEMASLRFVQIDEFYPINPRHTNSFFHYVNKFYLEGFGMDPHKALLINGEQIGLPEGTEIENVWGDDAVDLTLRHRHARTRREKLQQEVIFRVDQWCNSYEQKIREMGGIGFFLGGLGPDGHVAFNVRGSDFYSTTRLSPINYETQAASAGDLGGIEVAKKRRTITIGLSTITFNKDCTAIIMAAGEAKSRIVAEAVQSERGILYPATVLHDLKNACFYVTRGAAKGLMKRQLDLFERESELTPERRQQMVVDLAVKKGQRISELTAKEYRSDPFGTELLKKSSQTPAQINSEVEAELKEKIVAGMRIRKNKRFLHTEPHHDDVMLGYLPFVVRHIREHSNSHYFATFTSGFTSVTNTYMYKLCSSMKRALESDKYEFRRLTDEGYFDLENGHFKDHDVWIYLDGLATQSKDRQEEGTLRRFYRDLTEVFEDTDAENLLHRVEELMNYFQTQYPGKKDLPYIQTLKGMVREWESACLWGYFGWDSSSIEHLRLGFYKGEIFTEEPSVNRDVKPVLSLLHRIRPDVVTVAFDPEASGPDTHYKVLQSLAEALRVYRDETGREDIEVIGYRNVWYRFHPSEANVYVPVSLNMMTLQHSAFINTYISQKDASFPSHEFEGPFSLLTQKIQVEQYENLVRCLGRDFFYEHPSALIRATRGLAFIKSMSMEEFFSYSRELRTKAESKDDV
ncbi:MAG TPA: glucosamine-6-phosphate deaminase [Sediminispirochaeta sp.]|nr:glucosamine-6-phosphate deaminase [Sediminispirochaeta sp.]